jgi:hypothetical protein
MTSNGANMNTNDISIAVLSAVYNRNYQTPDFKTHEVPTEELAQYAGVYSSAQIPIKITFTIKDNTLVAQATGQPPFPLEATNKNKFQFALAGAVFEFDPAAKTVVLKQNGGEFLFLRE